jgi:hypothetical protein
MEIHPSLLMDHHRIQAEDQRDVNHGPYITFVQSIQQFPSCRAWALYSTPSQAVHSGESVGVAWKN